MSQLSAGDQVDGNNNNIHPSVTDDEPAPNNTSNDDIEGKLRLWGSSLF